MLGPRWAQNGPLERHFHSKIRLLRGLPSYGERPRADLGATWRRKRSKDASSSIWSRFWSMLERLWTNFEGFSMILHGLWQDFCQNSFLYFSSFSLLKTVNIMFTSVLHRQYVYIHTYVNVKGHATYLNTLISKPSEPALLAQRTSQTCRAHKV